MCCCRSCFCCYICFSFYSSICSPLFPFFLSIISFFFSSFIPCFIYFQTVVLLFSVSFSLFICIFLFSPFCCLSFMGASDDGSHGSVLCQHQQFQQQIENFNSRKRNEIQLNRGENLIRYTRIQQWMCFYSI